MYYGVWGGVNFETLPIFCKLVRPHDFLIPKLNSQNRLFHDHIKNILHVIPI